MATPIDPGYLLPGTRIGFYRIISRIAAGGFGALYRVERDGKPYALKIAVHKREKFAPEELRSYEERADRELVALKSLDHPNIVRVHAFERWPSLQEGYPFLIMDFVEGNQLNDWAAKVRPSLATLCAVFHKIALALHEMHRIEIYHRDLKSENLLVRRDGEPIIVDFGIARPLQARTVTRDHSFVGTSTHLAPEYCQFFTTEASQRGERFQFTPQADLHAVGFMFYELLAGRPPFPPAEDDVAMMLTIIRTVPPPAGQVNPRVPRSLESIAARLLEKDPKRRYANGRELADALDRALSQSDASWREPHPAPPVSDSNRPTRPDRPVRPPPPPPVTDPGIAALLGSNTSERDAPAGDDIVARIEAGKAVGAPAAAKPRRSTSRPFVLWSALAIFPLLALGAIAGGPPDFSSWTLESIKAAVETRMLPTPEQRALRLPADDWVLPVEPPKAPPEALPPLPSGDAKVPPRSSSIGAANGARSGRLDAAPEDPALGVPAGSELAVRLVNGLDAKGGRAAVEALLIHAVRGRKHRSLPAGTVLYGSATQSDGRFALRFTRAKLPDDRQIEIEGVAYDAGGVPGIAPTSRQGDAAMLAAGEEFTVLLLQGF